MRSYRLVVFFVLCFALAWPLQAAFLARGGGPTRQALLLVVLLVASWIPAVAALLVLTLTRDREERRTLRSRMGMWRVGGRWYLYAIFSPVLAWLGAIAAARALGVQLVFQPAFLAILPGILISNFGEELGWRGFALPHLLRRTNAPYAGAGLGLIWGVWHLGPPPAWSTLTPGVVVTQVGTLTALSVILTWIFVNCGGSLMLTTLSHAAFDATAFAFPAAAASEKIRIVLTVLLWIVAFLLFFGSTTARRTWTARRAARHPTPSG